MSSSHAQQTGYYLIFRYGNGGFHGTRALPLTEEQVASLSGTYKPSDISEFLARLNGYLRQSGISVSSSQMIFEQGRNRKLPTGNLEIVLSKEI